MDSKSKYEDGYVAAAKDISKHGITYAQENMTQIKGTTSYKEGYRYKIAEYRWQVLKK